MSFHYLEFTENTFGTVVVVANKKGVTELYLQDGDRKIEIKKDWIKVEEEEIDEVCGSSN